MIFFIYTSQNKIELNIFSAKARNNTVKRGENGREDHRVRHELDNVKDYSAAIIYGEAVEEIFVRAGKQPDVNKRGENTEKRGQNKCRAGEYPSVFYPRSPKKHKDERDERPINKVGYDPSAKAIDAGLDTDEHQSGYYPPHAKGIAVKSTKKRNDLYVRKNREDDLSAFYSSRAHSNEGQSISDRPTTNPAPHQ